MSNFIKIRPVGADKLKEFVVRWTLNTKREIIKSQILKKQVISSLETLINDYFNTAPFPEKFYCIYVVFIIH